VCAVDVDWVESRIGIRKGRNVLDADSLEGGEKLVHSLIVRRAIGWCCGHCEMSLLYSFAARRKETRSCRQCTQSLKLLRSVIESVT